jgi:hypothetical protein
MNQVNKKLRIEKKTDLFYLEPHILIFRRSLKVSQQVQQQRAAAAQAQQQQYNVLHMK